MNSISLNDQAHINCGLNTSTLFHQFDLWTSLFSVMMLIRHKGAHFFMLFYLTFTLTEKQRLTCLFLEECLNPPALSPLTQQEPCSSWLNEKMSATITDELCVFQMCYFIKYRQTRLSWKRDEKRNFVVHSISQQVTKQQDCRLAWRRKMQTLMIAVPVSRIYSWTFGLELKDFHRIGHILSIGEFSSVNSRNAEVGEL